MSYPPRPPLGLAPMPGGMIPQPFGYAPMGMMHVGMMQVPGMMRPAMSSMPPQPTSAPLPPVPRQQPFKKLVQNDVTKKDENKPPITTVFVGNISERAPDTMIRQMLQRCGNVLSWKRVQGASGKLQAFGFCEYEDPEATLRCMRLLNEWQIADKKLVVKVDAKTKNLLDEHKKKKQEQEQTNKEKKEEEKEEGEDRSSGEEDNALDEFTQREDRVAKAGLDAIMREYSEELNKEMPSLDANGDRKDKKKTSKKKEEEQKIAVSNRALESMELEEEKKDLINREIRSFRDQHKDENDKDREKEREKEREREREQRRRRDEEKERERERERERQRERERDRDRERREREQQRQKERPKSRSRTRDRSPLSDRNRERDIDAEDEEELYERRKLERRLREKEAAYQEMLKKWEARERKKAREYEKEKEREAERLSEEAKEARRLREFLEDYDDERDDVKYYKGSALQRRLTEREKEMEADERDRQRERDELEEIRKKLVEEGHPDLESEMARIEREREEHLLPRLAQSPEPESPSPVIESARTPETDHSDTPLVIDQKLPNKMAQTMRPVEPIRIAPEPVRIAPEPMQLSMSAFSSPEQSESSKQGASSLTCPPPIMSEDSMSGMSPNVGGGASKEEQGQTKLGFSGLKLGPSADSPNGEPHKRKRLTVGDVFNTDEEEIASAKRRKLIPLEYSEEEKASVLPAVKPTSAEEKRKCIKNLIERIPTAKEELFAYKLDWTMVDSTLMDRRIKPWVNKKIVEYIGEDEPTLSEFICKKVIANSTPSSILADISMVLDDEAEVFVVKMWRLLIYETEAKKLGLVK